MLSFEKNSDALENNRSFSITFIELINVHETFPIYRCLYKSMDWVKCFIICFNEMQWNPIIWIQTHVLIWKIYTKD